MQSYFEKEIFDKLLCIFQVENGNSTKAGQQSKTKTKTTKRPIKEVS